MLTIGGIPILADEIDILNTVKDQVYEQQGREILRKIKSSGNNIMICCPVHNFGQERKPSCGISIVDGKHSKAGTVHCFACGYVDSFEGMIAKCFGIDNPEWGKTWLMENFVTGESGDRPVIPFNCSRENKIEQVQYVSEEELAKYRFYHPYMWKRKLTPAIVEKYDVGYQSDYKVFEDEKTGAFMTDEVLTFPVKDINGKCLFVSRRSVNTKNFYLPPDMNKPVYGRYELPPDCKEVVICESVINALTSTSYGRPAVALFGTGNPYQYEQLRKLHVRKFVLALDPDKAGNIGMWKLKHALKGHILTKLLVPKGKDINDLSYEEFVNLPEIIF